MVREQIKRSSLDERRRDAREKIELGGLIVKAGLRGADRAALLAGLLDLARRLDDPDEHERLRREGVAAFGGKL